MALLQEASPSYLLLSNVYESFRDGRLSHVLRARVSHVTDGTYAGPLYIRSTRPSVIWGAGRAGDVPCEYQGQGLVGHREPARRVTAPDRAGRCAKLTRSLHSVSERAPSPTRVPRSSAYTV